jgi:hypothetical protein
MALDTYTGLQASIADWLGRSDVTSQIVDFITLTEAEFNRTLRVRQMEQRATATVTEYVELPTGFLELRNIQLNETPKVSLEQVTPDEIDRNYSGSAGKPIVYCLLANQLQFAPAPDGTYTVEIDYYEVIPPLASNASNWLLASYPDAYLYGCLLRGSAHAQDAAMVPAWEQAYKQVMSQMRYEDKKSRWSGSPLRVRAA